MSDLRSISGIGNAFDLVVLLELGDEAIEHINIDDKQVRG
jgi:hypothetical protein